jgi:hypothetical protein
MLCGAGSSGNLRSDGCCGFRRHTGILSCMANQLTADQRLVYDWCVEHADRGRDWIVLVRPRDVSRDINRPISVVFPAMKELLRLDMVMGGTDGANGGKIYYVVQR